MGTVGMGIALYDTVQVANAFSKINSRGNQARYLHKAYYNARTIDNVSYTSNNLRKKTFDLRTRNPIPANRGKITGWFKGANYALGNMLPVVACSSLALLCKGALAKIGALGIVLGVAYNIARNGFGLGKEHPMN